MPPAYRLGRGVRRVARASPRCPARWPRRCTARGRHDAVDPAALGRPPRRLLERRRSPRERRKGDATVRYDLRPFIEALAVDGTADVVTLRMTLRHDPERGVGRPDEVLAALADRMGGSAPAVDRAGPGATGARAATRSAPPVPRNRGPDAASARDAAEPARGSSPSLRRGPRARRRAGRGGGRRLACRRRPRFEHDLDPALARTARPPPDPPSPR